MWQLDRDRRRLA